MNVSAAGRSALHSACLALAAVLAIFPTPGDAASPPVRGLPFTRSYAYDEIGYEARGAQLAFDPLGRIALIQNGSFVVLNDATWTDIADKSTESSILLQFVAHADGVLYYCATGSWGTLESTPEGKLRPRPFLPAQQPPWVPVNNFTEIIPVGTGVFFCGWNGIVQWDRTTGEHTFLEVPQVSATFALKDQFFVSSFSKGILSLDRATRSLRRVEGPGIQGKVIRTAAHLDDDHVLVATIDQDLMVFDGRQLTPWPNELVPITEGRISTLARLPDNNIAVAIEGKGVFLLSTDGRILLSLTSPEYQRVVALEMREPGVLWMATERGIEKVLYSNPVTVIDHRLGVTISWPQVVKWKDRTLITSNGLLYESLPARDRATAAFELMNDTPAGGAWGIASYGEHLLVGNTFGVFAREGDGGFARILSDISVDRLVMVEQGLCYVIGATEITALRWADGRWSECAARIPGVGYPPLVQAAKKTAWIELGPNRAARISLDNGRLTTRIFDKFPWTQPQWIHVSVIGDSVIMSGPPQGRIYFDENTGTLTNTSPLQRVFDQAPYAVFRMAEDADGTIWASHGQGVFRIIPRKDGYDYELTALDIIQGRVPNIQIPDRKEVWISSKHSLYHIGLKPAFATNPATIKPLLVALVDGHSGHEIYGAMPAGKLPRRLPFTQNSLTFRFFAGNYAWVRSPSYEFRMNGEPILGTDSQLTLPDLREGAYHLEVRLANARGPVGESLALDFEIAPPWYRTWYAYTGYAVAGVLGVLSLVGWALGRAKSRNLALQWLVHERTEELQTTMHRLAEETSNAATLAERNRLAGEIHDSLQQGLSGLNLQLEATLKLSDLTTDVRSRLNVARNMVLFTRSEVQNAVWDLESPLLENTDLGDALNKMAALISSGGPQIETQVTGPTHQLSSSTNHHLLRIAQEAITNSVRHGAAQRITVLLHYAETSVSLAVNDDGCGFVPQLALKQERGHFGLRGLRSRVDKMNGEYKIVSAPGQGASIQVSIPITP